MGGPGLESTCWVSGGGGAVIPASPQLPPPLWGTGAPAPSLALACGAASKVDPAFTSGRLDVAQGNRVGWEGGWAV